MCLHLIRHYWRAALLGLFCFTCATAQPIVSGPVRIDIPQTSPRVDPNVGIDTYNRVAVRDAWLSMMAATSNTPLGWNGDVQTGNAGVTSQAYKDAVLKRVNWFRAMAGIPAVTLNVEHNIKAQKAVLMTVANNELSHNAPLSWLHYSPEGAEALMKSNLCLDYDLQVDPGCIDAYMRVTSTDEALRPRRWLLYPSLRQIASGDIPSGSSHRGGNALLVVGDAAWGPRPTTRQEFVAWPPPGFVPYQAVHEQISVSYPGADFSQAAASAVGNSGVGWGTVRLRRNPSAGDNTIVFANGSLDSQGNFVPERFPKGSLVRVRVENVLIDGVRRDFNYEFYAIDPTENGPDTVFMGSETEVHRGVIHSSVYLFTRPSTSWTAKSTAPWLRLTGATTGTGSGSIAYTVDFNATGQVRTGAIIVGSTSFNVTQQPLDSNCTLSLTPSAATIAASGASGSLHWQWTSVPHGSCVWNASSDSSWLHVYPLSGSVKLVTYTVFPNFSTVPRTGNIHIGGKTLTITQQGSSGSREERLVDLLYFSFFGRLPTAPERSFQAGALSSGLLWEDLAMNLLTSVEFNQGGRFIAGLYVGILDRDAEYDGWLFQRNALSTGRVNQVSLVQNFLLSEEYWLKFGMPDDPEFIRLLYRSILLREARQDEVDFQVSALRHLNTQGNGRVMVGRNFLNSQEFQIGTGPRLTAFLLYATLLLRDGTPAERMFRESQLKSPLNTSVRTLVRDLLASSEFSHLLN